jgi:RNA polymerase sigma-70 factor (ECF subfamily)
MNSAQEVSELIQAARQGEAAALGRLLDGYRNYLKLLARTGIEATLRAKADPSDAVQEALLRATRHFDSFRGATEAELAAWLRQILARHLANLVRHYRGAEARQLARERSLDDLLGASSAALGRLVAAPPASPSRAAERREMSVLLADALAELAPDHREVIVLRNLEEHEWDEIARRMDRTPGAARMLWARALKQLRPLLEARL